MNDSYSLKLNLAARFVPWIHLIFGSAGTYWLLLKLYGLGHSMSSSLVVLTAFLVGWVSFAGPLVAKVLSGPVRIDVKNGNEVTFVNTFGVRTNFSFDEILSLSIRWYVLWIRTTSGEYITTNGFPGFQRFVGDLDKHVSVKSVIEHNNAA